MFVDQNQQKSVWNLILFKNNRSELFLNMSLPIILGIIFISAWFDEANYLSSISPTLGFLIVLGIFELSYYLIIRSLFKASILSVELTAFGAVYKYSKLSSKQQRLALLGAMLVLASSSLVFGILIQNFKSWADLLGSWQTCSLLLFVINILPVPPTKTYLLLEAHLLADRQSSKLATFNKFSQYFLLFLLFFSMQYGSLLIVAIVVLLSIYGVNRIQKNKLLAEFSRYQLTDILIPKERLVCFSALLTSRKAVYLAVNSFQEHFPVLQEKKYLGLVTKSQLIKNIAIAEDEYLRALLDRKQVTVRMDQTLDSIAQIFLTTNYAVLPVLDFDDNFIGLVVKDKVSEFDLIKNIEDQNQKDKDSEL